MIVWKENLIELLRNILRFMSFIFLLFDAILLAVFSTWFTYKIVFFTIDWLSKTVFSKSWAE
jgi:hypothetical protein